MILTFFISLLFLPSAHAQTLKSESFTSNDTLVQVESYWNDDQPVENKHGVHKIVHKFLNYYLLETRWYKLNGQTTEDERGIHYKRKFWRHFRFYDRTFKPLQEVVDPYSYEKSDATYCIYNYDEAGRLTKVTYYKDEVDYDQQQRVIARRRLKAVESYETMIHKFTYNHSKNSKILKEYSYDKNNKLRDSKTLKLKKSKKVSP